MHTLKMISKGQQKFNKKILGDAVVRAGGVFIVVVFVVTTEVVVVIRVLVSSPNWAINLALIFESSSSIVFSFTEIHYKHCCQNSRKF